MKGRSAPDRNRVEPAALQFLRENSSYLTPRNGIFSGDTWSLIAIYVRNLILNWLIIIPIIAAVVAIPYFLILATGFLPLWLRMVIGILLAISAVLYPTLIPAWPDVGQEERQREASPIEKKHFYWMQLPAFLWARLLPLEAALFFLASFLSGSMAKASKISFFGLGHVGKIIATQIFLFGFILPVLFVLAWGIYVSWKDYGSRTEKLKTPAAHFTFALQTAGSICSIVATVWLAKYSSVTSPWLFVWFPAVGTINFLLAGTVFAALVDPLIEDENREWWARSAGYFLMFTLFWVAVSTVSISIPALFGLLLPVGLTGDDWLLSLLGRSHFGDFFVVAGPTVFAGSGVITFLTRLEKGVSEAAGFWSQAQNWMRKILFSISMTVFGFLLLVGVAGAVFWGANQWTRLWAYGHYSWSNDFLALAWVIAILLVFCLMMSLPVNINRFSAHIAYRNRLVRTFLGASNLKRKSNPFTGFSQKDNIYLHAMVKRWHRPSDESDSNEPPRKAANEKPYQRPFHILCAAANLATGERLAWQERKAVSFTFSGLHTGSNELGYRPSAEFSGGRGITLGTAMAVSGAAANSGMGFYSSPLKSFLLTLLNARLGWWLGNPGHADSWKRNSPLFAIGPLVKELFSLTNRKAKWIDVSDGGHFDNTGVYEMLQRKCTRIILFDAETTRKGITNVAQRARIDMGVQMRLAGISDDGFPCEYYQIQYLPDAANKAREGTLIRIYPAISSVSLWSAFENCERKRTNPAFPDDSLEDQFFTESTFESYRKLGADIVGQLVSGQSSDSEGIVSLEQFFDSCVRRTKQKTSRDSEAPNREFNGQDKSYYRRGYPKAPKR